MFAPIGSAVLGGTLDKLLIISVLTSASASTQTTILPTARTVMSMARMGALPRAFAHVHRRHLSPDVSMLAMGGASAVLLVLLTAWDTNLVFDAFTALGLMIAFYYGITGFACAIFYRRELRRSARNLAFMGVLPVAGGVMLGYVLVKSFIEIVKPDSGFAGPIFGVGAPFAIAVVAIVMGAVLLIVSTGRYREFFARRREVAETLAG